MLISKIITARWEAQPIAMQRGTNRHVDGDLVAQTKVTVVPSYRVVEWYFFLRLPKYHHTPIMKAVWSAFY